MGGAKAILVDVYIDVFVDAFIYMHDSKINTITTASVRLPHAICLPSVYTHSICLPSSSSFLGIWLYVHLL